MKNFSAKYMGQRHMNEPQELITLKDFTDILERLEIEYVIGGSIASSLYGKVRFTEDADVTVEPFAGKADEFFRLVRSDFYINWDAMQQALRQKSSFNVVHLKSAFKIDVFIQNDTEFEKQLLSRRKFMKLSEGFKKAFSVVSAEDIVLLKLRWYQQGDCTSERQWDDLVAVMEVQAKKLDLEYMKKWAATLGINELLEKAVSEIG